MLGYADEYVVYEEVQDQGYKVVHSPRKNYDTFIIKVRYLYHISKWSSDQGPTENIGYQHL